MSRWHTNCDNPDIFVDGALPRCRNCGKAPSDTEITPPEHTPDPPWTIPPDEPAGQLSLYWPSCVQYRKDLSVDETTSEFGLGWLFDGTLPVFPEEDEPLWALSDFGLGWLFDGTLPVPPEEENLFDSSSGLSVSSLYPRCLKPREFRLMWLEPPERPDYPVHLTLETYDRDNCPEYEATSYLWGGEDGDYSPSEPVYIGPHWDILFQTKSCWSMLKYLRPWRGIRTVWIDAICINQGDLKEREDQVEAMRETYQRSMRLVVYLRDDVVQKRDQYSYPMRCGLEEIGKTQVYQLFQRSVLNISGLKESSWIMSNPLNGEDRRQIRGLNSKFRGLGMSQRDHTWVPIFVEYWHRHGYPKELIPVIRYLGFWGYFDDKYRGATRSLKPDYSITRAHIMIGAFAYQLPNLKECAILTEAIGLDAPHPYPSWVPRWIFSSTFTQTNSGYLRFGPVEFVHEESAFFRFIEDLLKEYERFHAVLIQQGVEDILQRSDDCSRTWRQGLAIKPSNAGLTLTLVHLLDFEGVRLRYSQCRSRVPGFPPGTYICHYEIATSSCKLCFSTRRNDLSTTVSADSLELFPSNHVGKGITETDLFIIILQKIGPNEDYKMVTCFTYGRLLLVGNSPPQQFRQAWDERNCPYRMFNSLSLTENLKSVIEDAQSALWTSTKRYQIHESGDTKAFCQLFANLSACDRPALDMIQGYINELRGVVPGFLESYERCLGEMMGQDQFQLEDDHLVFTLPISAWEELRECYSFEGFLDKPNAHRPYEYRQGFYPMKHCKAATRKEIEWQWLDDTGDIAGWRLIDHVTVGEKARPRGDFVRVRAKISDIRRFVELSRSTAAISRLSAARAYFDYEINETEIYLRESQLGDESKFLACNSWPQVAIDEFKMDGRLKTVTIL
ncbi:Heterokaryon incompatibility protein (HET) domain containing protein [Rhypophila decipiens]